MKDGKEFDDITNHHYNRSESDAQESESIILIVQSHDIKTNDQNYDSYEHQYIITFLEGKFFFVTHV